MSTYRAWTIINPPSEAQYQEVDNPEKGAEWIKQEIKRQLKLRSIWGNAFGLEVCEGSCWSEWYNGNGEDVLEAFGIE